MNTNNKFNLEKTFCMHKSINIKIYVGGRSI